MINLLPPQYKEELAKEEKFRLILISGTIVLIFLVGLALILFSVKFYIQGKTDILKARLQAEEDRLQITEVQALRREIAASNKMIDGLRSFYQAQRGPIGILEKTFQTFPEEIYLTSFSWQKETAQVTLSGISPSRELLFELKNNLEAEEEFSGIYFPPQNWIKPVDIDFQATFKVR